MKDFNVPIDQAGRIVLPKPVREELAIKVGDTFKVSIHGISITLTPEKAINRLTKKGKALVFTTTGGEILTNDSVNHLIEQSREGREDTGLLSALKKRRA